MSNQRMHSNEWKNSKTTTNLGSVYLPMINDFNSLWLYIDMFICPVTCDTWIITLCYVTSTKIRQWFKGVGKLFYK